MKPPARAALLAGGLLSLDILLNLPGLIAGAGSPGYPGAGSAGYPGSWTGSLLKPSIDLLVVSAILVMGSQPSETPGRRAARFVGAAVVVLFDLYAAGSRLSVTLVLVLIGVVGAAAVGTASWFAAGFVLRGFESRLSRSVFIAMVAVAAILQVLLRGRLFGPSVVPAAIRDMTGLLR